jgi:uncharacterized protein YqhQ
MKAPTRFTSIGGQAVIEGVMMRSPHYIAVAVRKPSRKIVIRNFPHRSVAERFSFLKKPVLRGVVMLFESMVQGIQALSYSANVAAMAEAELNSPKPSEGGKTEELSTWAIALSIGSALVLGMGLFVALPHFLTALLTSSRGLNLTAQSPIFHLLDGVLKMSVLLAYVYLIAMMEDIHRVFQYHGAEHKSIYAFEAGEELTVENARHHSTLHPRCGTSFLLFLVLISILVFSAVFPLFGLSTLSPIPIVNHLMMIGVKILLMFPVAGLAYEFIKMCACRMDNPVFRAMVWPGMVLQKLTTREPSDEQLEVALASLRQVLRLEKAEAPALAVGAEHQTLAPLAETSETEISALSDLGRVQASVSEFPEL